LCHALPFTEIRSPNNRNLKKLDFPFLAVTGFSNMPRPQENLCVWACSPDRTNLARLLSVQQGIFGRFSALPVKSAAWELNRARIQGDSSKISGEADHENGDP
jgi:hypothetical protein